MKAIDFNQELQNVASEMKLTKNIFTLATKEQLEVAANSCIVENYKWETAQASFLIKDNVIKGVRLFDNEQEVDLFSNNIDENELYVDFKSNGILC